MHTLQKKSAKKGQLIPMYMTQWDLTPPPRIGMTHPKTLVTTAWRRMQLCREHAQKMLASGRLHCDCATPSCHILDTSRH